MTDRVGLSRLYIAWHYAAAIRRRRRRVGRAGPRAGRRQDLAALSHAWSTSKQIAQDVQAIQDGSEIAGLFMVVVTARPGHTLAEVEAAALEEIDRLQTEPPTAEEVARAVNSFESRFVKSLEPISEFGGRADQLEPVQRA